MSIHVLSYLPILIKGSWDGDSGDQDLLGGGAAGEIQGTAAADGLQGSLNTACFATSLSLALYVKGTNVLFKEFEL